MDIKKKKMIDEIKNETNSPVKTEKRTWTSEDLIPSGSTILNLALSDTPYGGYGKGKIVNLVGDYSTGKTLLALTMLAEISMDPRFDNYNLIFHDTEVALEFDIPYLFGNKVADRIELIEGQRTIQEWYRNHLYNIEKGVPFIYITDSFDGIISEEERKRGGKMLKKMKAEAEGKADDEKEKGSYKTEKARWSSEAFRNFAEGVEKTNSLSLIISQTRDNIGVMFGPKQTKSGGKAMNFWICHEIWLSASHPEKAETASGSAREIGMSVFANVKKNKMTGKRRQASFPVYYDYGVDDIASCINFLIDEKHWERSRGVISAKELNVELKMPELIKYVETESLEGQLKAISGQVWHEIEESIRLTDRKKKY